MPDPTLDLDLPDATAGAPFTRGGSGLPRAAFERRVRSGAYERVLHGVYAPAGTARDRAFRAAAVRLALGPGAVATRRTAAWVHGVDLSAFAGPDEPPVPLQRGRPPDRDVVTVGTVRVTTPQRTALDLARHDVEPVALAAADALLAAGLVPATGLLAGLALAPYDARVRELVGLADGRAAGAVESVLRLQWLRSRLPTPVPGLVVPGRSDVVRLALGLPVRRFGVLLRSAVGAAGASGPDLAHLRDRGWWVAVLDDARVLGSEPARLRRHLEREYHQALLADVG